MAETFEVLQEVTVDVSKSIPAPTVFCKQADNVVRVLRVTIQDNKEDYPIPAGFVARLRGTKADGTRIYLDARSAAENVAEFILTQNALAAYGKATCEVELSNSAGDVVKSCNLVLNVQKTAMDDSAVESTDEFQSLDAAAAAAQAAQKAAEDAANKTATDAKNAAQSAADAKEAAKTAGDAASKVTNAGVDEKLAEMQEIQDDVTAKQAQTATDAVAAAEAKTEAEAAQADAAASKTAAESSASAAKESEKAAAKSAEEAKASTPASTLDGMYTAMLDGTNTQKIFKLWWPFAVTQSENKYSCLERFAAMLDTAWGDKTYTVRNIHESVSGDASGTPLDDLADGRSAAPLVTDASTGVADWAENDPMTWYVRANAKSLADGTMEVLAVETEAAFDVTGETAPVYCFSPALAVKEWDDGSYLYTSWHMRAGDGYVPMAGDVAPDGTHRLLTWHPAFYGGKNSAGGMTSGAGLLPMPWTSANAALPLARKLTAYDGLWCDCDTQFALMAWRLRHWTLSNSGQLEGCTYYNYQYTLAAAETGVKRVLLTKAQGTNLLVGSCVCLGERGSNTNNDRNQAYNHDVFNIAKILSVETVTVNDTEYAAVNLDLASTIDTTTTMLVSTMPWPNGTTEALPGHSDGCIGSLTNGKYPYRIAGMEMQIGSYCEELDPLWQASLVDDDHWHYDVYSCRDSEKLAGSITANYQKVGEFDLPNANKWSWNFIRALNKMAAEAQIPTKFGGSTSTYVKAAFFSPGGAGVFAPWRFGSLCDGGSGGLPCAYGRRGPGTSAWYGVPRLAGSGKKRGEWPA
ncbi:BppU family phage baseplate upper protein [Gemmiger sp.]|uniref:BppU family phage baseplate upper protein n=1 Tax=Gemmiger sp. TaxID=2049027 RepID=UPI003A959EB8